jgi:hypothetical protein
MKKLTIVAAAVMALGGVFAEAESSEKRGYASPVGLSLAAPLQFPRTVDSVYGFRYNVFMALNKDMIGLDLGLVGINTGCLKGMQVNAFNWVNESVDAFQIGALANVALDDVAAFQIGTFNIVRGDFAGLQLGLANIQDEFAGFQIGGLLNWNSADSFGVQFGAGNANIENFTGFSCGAVNWASEMTGFQLGVVNVAERATGLQIGVYNAVEDMDGVQLGFVNLICEGPLPVMTVANASF